jgi:hypothetical protein
MDKKDETKGASAANEEAGALKNIKDTVSDDGIAVPLSKPLSIVRNGEDVEVTEVKVRAPDTAFYLKTGDYMRDLTARMSNGEQAYMPERIMDKVLAYLTNMTEPSLTRGDMEDLSFADFKKLEAAFDRIMEPF